MKLQKENRKNTSFRFFNIIAILLVLIPMITFSAEASNNPIETDTQIEIEQGVIEITQVPSLYFTGDATGFGIIGGTLEGQPKGEFVIEDARGTNAGWSLYISLGKFVDVATPPKNKIGAPVLTMEAPQIVLEGSSEQSEVVGYKTELVAGDENFYKIVSAPPGTLGGVWIGTVPLASLKMPKETNKAALYRTKLNWSIHDTP